MQLYLKSSLILVCLPGLISTDNLDEDSGNSRQKRSASTCSAIYSFRSSHSACVPRSSNVIATGVTAAEKTLILDEHNKHRRNANPTAEDMNKLYWNDEVAYVAQAWAENCVFAHDENFDRYVPGRYNLGQNLAKSSIKSPWANMINAWHNEVNQFTYAGNNAGKTVGHYTQMMSAKATLIGCGYAECNKSVGSDHLFVCNYGPPGKTNNKPYTNGTTCAQCAGSCSNKLCDCNGLVCLNGGTLDLNTCTCTCRRAHYELPNDCALNCSIVNDPWQCGSGSWTADKCHVFANLPYDCPSMCNICPYGGIGYLSSFTTSTTSSTSSGVSSTSSSTTSSGVGGTTSSGVGGTTSSGGDSSSTGVGGRNTSPEYSAASFCRRSECLLITLFILCICLHFIN